MCQPYIESATALSDMCWEEIVSKKYIFKGDKFC